MAIIGVFLLVVAFGLFVAERSSRDKSRLFGSIPPPVAILHLWWIGCSFLLALAGIMCIVYDIVKPS